MVGQNGESTPRILASFQQKRVVSCSRPPRNRCTWLAPGALRAGAARPASGGSFGSCRRGGLGGALRAGGLRPLGAGTSDVETRLWLSKPVGSHFGVGAPPILEPTFVGIGMFTGGTVWILTHGHISSVPKQTSFATCFCGNQKGGGLFVHTCFEGPVSKLLGEGRGFLVRHASQRHTLRLSTAGWLSERSPCGRRPPRTSCFGSKKDGRVIWPWLSKPFWYPILK